MNPSSQSLLLSDGPTDHTIGELMPDSKITDLTALLGSAVAGGDYVPVVDVSDTTMAASGTNKKVAWSGIAALWLPQGSGGLGDVFTTGDPTGATSSTSALQTLIDSVPALGGGTGVPAHTIWIPEGVFDLSGLQITKKAIVFRGMGRGNPADYGSSSAGRGTTLSFGGAAAGTMINIRDSQFIHFEDIFFEGSSAAVPAQLIYFENAGGTSGTNQQLTFARCHFGGYAWSTQAAEPTRPFATIGVRFGGTNANNDQFHFQDCGFEGCTTGLDVQNAQSIWGFLSNVFFDRCGTGLKTAASIEGVNVTATGSTVVDVSISGGRTHISGFYSEGSAKVVSASAGTFSAVGGLITVTDTLTDANFIDHSGNGGGTGGNGLSLHDVFLSDQYTGTPLIKSRGVSSAVPGYVGIYGGNIAQANLDITSPGGSAVASTVVDIHTSTMDVRHVANFTNQTFTGQDNYQTPAFAASFTPDLSQGSTIVVGALSANITVNAPTNGAPGQRFTIVLTENGTGGWTITWNAAYKNLSPDITTASTVNVHHFVWDGTNARQLDADSMRATVLTADGQLLSRASGIPTPITRASLAADAAFTGAYQPLDSDLTSIAALSTTSYGRAFLELANQAATMALLSSSSATASGIVELATDAETVTGTDTVRAVTPAGAAAAYQPLDSDLTSIAAVSTTSYGRAFLALANQAATMALLSAASDTAQGIVELATDAETLTGTDTARATTPANVASVYVKIAQAVNAQTGTTYTLVAGDAGKLVSLSNASSITLTLPQDSDATIAIGTYVDLYQLGAGQVTTVAGTGATLRTSGLTAKARAQYARFGVQKVSANTWSLFGDLAAS